MQYAYEFFVASALILGGVVCLGLAALVTYMGYIIVRNETDQSDPNYRVIEHVRRAR